MCSYIKGESGYHIILDMAANASSQLKLVWAGGSLSYNPDCLPELVKKPLSLFQSVSAQASSCIQSVCSIMAQCHNGDQI